MSVRATYALDQGTADRIRELARAWGVSQAEVIRRSVERAAQQECAPSLSPAGVVDHYLHVPLPRSEAETRRLIASLRQSRHEDDERRSAES